MNCGIFFSWTLLHLTPSLPSPHILECQHDHFGSSCYETLFGAVVSGEGLDFPTFQLHLGSCSQCSSYICQLVTNQNLDTLRWHDYMHCILLCKLYQIWNTRSHGNLQAKTLWPYRSAWLLCFLCDGDQIDHPHSICQNFLTTESKIRKLLVMLFRKYSNHTKCL